MKVAVLVLAALAVTGCMGRGVPGSSSGGGAAGATKLEISISLGGKSPTKLWTLHCPSGGTVPHPERACSRLDGLDAPFAPVPNDVACTEVYGGPQVADVSGMFHGKPVNTRFTRTDGCEIARWNQVRFLFPGVR